MVLCLRCNRSWDFFLFEITFNRKVFVVVVVVENIPLKNVAEFKMLGGMIMRVRSGYVESSGVKTTELYSSLTNSCVFF